MKQLFQQEQMMHFNMDQIELITQICENPQPSKYAQQNSYSFFLSKFANQKVLFSSQFDSGNMAQVFKLSDYQFKILPSNDCAGTKYQGCTKSWFYFYVTGFPQNFKVKFIINKINILWSVYNVSIQKQSNQPQSYSPVYRSQNTKWLRLNNSILEVLVFKKVNENNDLQLTFEYKFSDTNEKVFFAFCYPFSYSDCEEYIMELKRQWQNRNQLYFFSQIFTNSPQDRNIHLLTLSDYNQIQTNFNQNVHQIIFDQLLFPEKSRPFKFKKPHILITARVHPGQTPSSFVLKGILQFLFSNDLRAVILRELFVFKIVPMLNPDGVYHGHYRMDKYYQNLNRYYNLCYHDKQPSIYAIKSLTNYIKKESKLLFYFDLHAHGSKKGNFMYGNAIDDFVQQVQSYVFCKLVSLNCLNFQYQSCNFSKKHMKARDRFEELTKEGCGRVVIHKQTGVIHSYTLECGFISSNIRNTINEVSNSQFQINNLGLITDQLQNNENQIYKDQSCPKFTINIYKNLGKNLLVSVLDTYDMNPFNRIINSKYKNMSGLRRSIAYQVFHQVERFRMFQQHIFKKVKNINQLIEQIYLSKYVGKFVHSLRNVQFFLNFEWPQNNQSMKKVREKEKEKEKLKQKQKQKLKDRQKSKNVKEQLMKTTLNFQNQLDYKLISNNIPLNFQKKSDLDKKIHFQKLIKPAKSQRNRNILLSCNKKRSSVFQLQISTNLSAFDQNRLMNFNACSIPFSFMYPHLRMIKKDMKYQIKSSLIKDSKKKVESKVQTIKENLNNAKTNQQSVYKDYIQAKNKIQQTKQQQKLQDAKVNQIVIFNEKQQKVQNQPQNNQKNINKLCQEYKNSHYYFSRTAEQTLRQNKIFRDKRPINIAKKNRNMQMKYDKVSNNKQTKTNTKKQLEYSYLINETKIFQKNHIPQDSRFPDIKKEKSNINKMKIIDLEKKNIDLNELMKKTLKWQALKMRELLKKYSKK